MNDTEAKVPDFSADVSAQRIAKTYAEALLNAAEKRGNVDLVFEELDSLIRDVFAADPQFEAFLATTAIGRDQKEATLRKLFEGRAGETLANFLYVLNKHDRLGLLRPIAAAARDLRDRRANRRPVQVVAAVPLPDDQRERLARELRDSFHFEPLLETSVDPALIGGMVVRVGDWIYDASVRTRLGTIRKQLIERSSYEIQSRRDRFSSSGGN
jgi:F-type H+-transporting ATPase subunit delta